MWGCDCCPFPWATDCSSQYMLHGQRSERTFWGPVLPRGRGCLQVVPEPPSLCHHPSVCGRLADWPCKCLSCGSRNLPPPTPHVACMRRLRRQLKVCGQICLGLENANPGWLQRVFLPPAQLRSRACCIHRQGSHFGLFLHQAGDWHLWREVSSIFTATNGSQSQLQPLASRGSNRELKRQHLPG